MSSYRENRRSSHRIHLDGAGYDTVLLSPSENYSCAVVDFSSSGLRFKVPESYSVPEFGRLSFRGMTFDYSLVNETVIDGERYCGVTTMAVRHDLSNVLKKYNQFDDQKKELNRRIWKRRLIAFTLILAFSHIAGRIGLIRPFFEGLARISGGVGTVGEKTASGIGTVAGNLVEKIDKVHHDVTPWIATEVVKITDEYVDESIRNGTRSSALSPEQALKQLEDLTDHSESNLEDIGSTTSNPQRSEKFTTFSFKPGKNRQTNSAAESSN